MGKIIAAIVIVIAILAGGYFWKMSFSSGDAHVVPMGDSQSGTEVKTEAAGIVYYYGEECPHCKDVMKFLEENKIAEKVTFEKKEVWHDRANAAEMSSKAKTCGLDPKQTGVPFVFADGKCYIGTPDVTGFFKKAAGL